LADISTFTEAKDYILITLGGLAAWLFSQVRRADIRLLEERITRLERDHHALAAKVDDHWP
jgi:hypothetical protein